MISTSRTLAAICLTWLICGEAFCQGSLLDSNYSGYGIDFGYSQSSDNEAGLVALGYSAGGDVDFGLLVGRANKTAIYGVYANAFAVKQGRDNSLISVGMHGIFLRQHDGAGGSSFSMSAFPTFRIGVLGLQPRVGVGFSSGDADSPVDRIAASGGLVLFLNFNNQSIFFVSSSVSTKGSKEAYSVSSGFVFPFGKKPRTKNTGRKRQPSMCFVPPQPARSH